MSIELPPRITAVPIIASDQTATALLPLGALPEIFPVSRFSYIVVVPFTATHDDPVDFIVVVASDLVVAVVVLLTRSLTMHGKRGQVIPNVSCAAYPKTEGKIRCTTNK